MSIEQTLQKIAAWLELHAPPLRKKLNSPATLAQIQQVEQALNVTLPPSVRKAYQVHNGEIGPHYIIDGFSWLSLDRMMALHHEQRNIEAEYGFGTFKAEFMIPILDGGNGEFLYIESVPSPTMESELISYWHEEPKREVKSATFADFLAAFASNLSAGHYIFDDPDFPRMLINRNSALG